jgi:hypothetical protein
MLKILTTATCEAEVDVLMARLSEAGVRCMRGAQGGRVSTLCQGLDVLIEEEDLPKARAVLEETDGGFDEDELTKLSMDAGERLRPPRQ